MESFGPKFLGLTGPSDNVARAAKSFKINLERIQLSADPTDYVMKHASPIFVMRPSDPHPAELSAARSPVVIEAALRGRWAEAGGDATAVILSCWRGKVRREWLLALAG